jgi:hypothetical protein
LFGLEQAASPMVLQSGLQGFWKCWHVDAMARGHNISPRCLLQEKFLTYGEL